MPVIRGHRLWRASQVIIIIIIIPAILKIIYQFAALRAPSCNEHVHCRRHAGRSWHARMRACVRGKCTTRFLCRCVRARWAWYVPSACLAGSRVGHILCSLTSAYGWHGKHCWQFRVAGVALSHSTDIYKWYTYAGGILVGMLPRYEHTLYIMSRATRTKWIHILVRNWCSQIDECLIQ